MPTAITTQAIVRARKLRRDLTDGERKLWAELRHVRQQAHVGNYVADFLMHAHKLIIEIDGEHHFTPAGQLRDRKRDDWFGAEGFRVLRFNTGELDEQFEGCVEEILRSVGLMTTGEAGSPSRRSGCQ